MLKLVQALQTTLRASFSINVVAFLFFKITFAHAQTLPNAGTIEQSVDEQLPQKETQDAAELLSAPKQIKPTSGPSFTLADLKFTGNSLVATEQLQELAKPYINKPVDFNGLQHITAEVAEYYRALGWLARVYLPRQEIVEGSVTMQVVEARMGRLRFDGSASQRLQSDQVEQYVEYAQPQDELLSVKDLDRALLLINDLPGVNVSGNLSAGETLGETDLLLKASDKNLVTGSVSVANIGSRSTGSEQVGVNLYLNSPSKIGDQAELNLLKSQGLNYGRIGYSLPYKYSGLRFGVNATHMDYDVVTSDFKALDLAGEFTSVGVHLNYPLLRSRTQNVNLSAYFDNKRYLNTAADLTTSDYRSRNLGLSVKGSNYDAFYGGGSNQAKLSLTVGELDLGLLNFSDDERLAGRFSKLHWWFARRQYLAPAWTLNLKFSGQWSDSNLASSEKFYLGGAQGVRAYPSNEGGGVHGYKFSADMTYQPRAGINLSVFTDWGRVRRYLNNSVAQASPNRYELSGVGLSALWLAPQGIQLSANYSHRLGNNPNSTPDGNDQDGSLKRHRFWLVASYSF